MAERSKDWFAQAERDLEQAKAKSKAGMRSTMPVRSLNSSVLKWPSRKAVDRAIRSWTAEQVEGKPDIIRLGYFGSYARDDWGVGSDLDVIAVVKDASEPFERRALQWDFTELPVPAEIIVYTWSEWEDLQQRDTKFARMLNQETVWTFS